MISMMIVNINTNLSQGLTEKSSTFEAFGNQNIQTTDKDTT